MPMPMVVGEVWSRETELGKARDHEDYEGADHVGILHTMAFVGKGEEA